MRTNVELSIGSLLRYVGVIGSLYLILAGTTVQALEPLFYSSNDILYYDPDAAACSTASGAAPTGAKTEVAPSENTETILKYFTDKGLSLAAAAAIAGNLKQESGLNPAIIEGGAIAPDNYIPVNGKGFGLAQWSFSDRQRPLVQFAKAQGVPITDINMQLDYIWKEMAASQYDYMVGKLNDNKTDPVAAAVVFHGLTPNIDREGSGINPVFRAAEAKYGYERSGNTSDEVVNNRGGAAKAYYSLYRNKIQDGTGIAARGPASSETGEGATPTNANCDAETQAGDLSPGSGKFTDAGEVKNWATVQHNALAVDRLFGSRMEGDGYCASIVSRTWRGQDIGYGVELAIQLWQQNATNGIGHADRNPKKGAILIYSSARQAAGHVTIYLGNNKILNDGHIRDADFVEGGGWNEHYLGWIDPNDLGWKSSSASDATLRAIFDNAKYLIR